MLILVKRLTDTTSSKNVCPKVANHIWYLNIWREKKVLSTFCPKTKKIKLFSLNPKMFTLPNKWKQSKHFDHNLHCVQYSICKEPCNAERSEECWKREENGKSNVHINLYCYEDHIFLSGNQFKWQLKIPNNFRFNISFQVNSAQFTFIVRLMCCL